ncbi:MAG: hypothetical protein ACOY0T_20620 [Myxococcota bacterium]
MTVESKETTWYWLRPDREQVRGTLSELKSLLSARALPRSTLVWTEPWPEWLPATEVGALASVLPPSPPRSIRPETSAPPLKKNDDKPNVAKKADPKQAAPKIEAIRVQAVGAKAELPRTTAKSEVQRSETPKPQVAKPEAPDPQVAKATEAPKPEAPKPQVAKATEAPKPEAPKRQVAAEVVGKPSAPRPELANARRPAPPSSQTEPSRKEPATAEPVDAEPETRRLGAEAIRPEVASASVRVEPPLAEPVRAEPAVEVVRAEPAVEAVRAKPAVEAVRAELAPIQPGPVNAPPNEAAQTALVRDEVVQAEAPRSEVVQAELVRAEALQAEAPRSEVVQAEPPHSDGTVSPHVDLAASDRIETQAAAAEAVQAPAAKFERVPAEPVRLGGAPAVLAEAVTSSPAAEPVASGEVTAQPASSSATSVDVEEPAFDPRRALTSSEAPVALASREDELRVEPRASTRRARTALWVVSGACGVLALALGFTLRALRAQPLTVAVQTNVPAPTPTPAAPKQAECSLLIPAAKLAPSIERSVEPTVVALNDGRVAVGFASAPAQAQGIVVDLGSLDVARVFEDSGDARVSQVTASVDQAPRFSVERDELDFGSARVLGSSPLLAVGLSKEALVGRVGNEKKVLWSLPVGHGAEPRAARTGDGAYQIALRRGGPAGELVVGSIAPDGRALGELEPIETGVRLLGTPAIAASKDALVVFAGRDRQSEPYRLRAAGVRPGHGGARAVDVPLPAAEGNGAIAPAVAALGDDAWVLQWTQGEVGKYRVFVQALNAELAPLGSAVPVSPMGTNAGQGLVRVVGERTLSLFVLPVPGHDELWGAVLKCR